MSNNPHYNNIFNKKNIEFQLDGQNKSLPYVAKEEVSLKANQIIFSSINNVFQKFLDNDLYNEALLKKYIEYGYIGGPTYVNSIEQIEHDFTENRKFVVSGENGISVLRKEEVPLSDTIDGRFLDGTKVNKIEFINERFIACTKNGIYESVDKENWNRVIGEDGYDVKDICYNQNFLIRNRLSAFDYIAAVNVGLSTQFYGHNGTDNTWKDFSKDQSLSDIMLDGVKSERVYTFEDDPLFYVGTNNRGLLASELVDLSDGFSKEIGTDSWSVYDMNIIPNEDEFEKYILATNYGIKQSQKMYGFRNLRRKFSSITYVFDVLKLELDDSSYYVATGEGLFYLKNGEAREVEALHGKQCFSLTYDFPHVYVGTETGIYRISDTEATQIGFDNQNVSKILYSNGHLFACVDTGNKVFYSSDLYFWDTPDIDFTNETVKQFKAYKNTVYVVTDKSIYALINGDGLKVFSWKPSIADSSNVYFSQNLIDAEILLQIENGICVIDTTNGIEKFRISDVDPLTSNAKITSAIKHNNSSYYIVIDSILYSIYKDDNDQWIVDEVIVNDETVSAKQIANFPNLSYNGIAFIDDSNKVKFLKIDGSSKTIETLSKNNTHKDVSVIENSIYSISADKTIARYDIGTVLNLSKTQEISSNDGIALKQYVNGGFVKDRIKENDGFKYILSNDAYLSSFSNKVDLSIWYNPTSELCTSFSIDGISCVDFIGYANNSDLNKTLLVGGEHGVSAFNVEINTDANTIQTPTYVKTVLNTESNAFNDICYRRKEFNDGSIVNAVNVVGAEDGLYALYATSAYVKQCDTQFNINNVVEGLDGKRYAATDSGVVEFNPQADGDFAIISYPNKFVNHIYSSGKKLIASRKDGDLLDYSNFVEDQEYSGWRSAWDGSASPFVNYTYDDETGDLTGIYSMSSDSGCIVSAILPTISYIENGAAKTDILENAIQLSNDSINSIKITKLYKDTDNKVKIADIYGNVYEITLGSDYGETHRFSTNELLENEKDLSSIFISKLANFYKISDTLSIGMNDMLLNNIDDRLNKDFNGILDDDPIISLQNNIEFFNIISADVVTASKTIVRNANFNNFQLSGNDAFISGNVDFSNSVGLISLDIVPTIELSGIFLSSVMSSDIVPIYDEYGNPVYVENVSVIVDPLDDTHTITIQPGEQLSDFIIDSFMSAANIDYISFETIEINQNNQTFEWHSTDISSILSNYVPQFNSEAIYKLSFNIRNICYENDIVFGSKIALSYETSSNITYFGDISKSIFPLQETIDDIYYDDVYYGNENEKENVTAFCVKYSNSTWLMYDGFNLYAFDSFIERNRQREAAIVQLSKTYINESFNDLYYFYLGDESLPYYAVRKTNISFHDKNFDIAKDETSFGTITKTSLEGDVLYVLKGNDLYYTDSNAFPQFSLIGTQHVEQIASCDEYTLIFDGTNIYKYVDGVAVGSAISISNIGMFKNFFIEDGEILCKTDTGVWQLQENSETFTKVLNFNQTDIVRSFFFDNSFYHTHTIIGNDSVYANEMLYDFRNGNYTKINEINDKIVDIKTINPSDKNPHLIAASNTALYDVAFSGFDSIPSYSVYPITIDGVSFNDIRSIYFSNGNQQLYVIDGIDLYIFNVNVSNSISITPLTFQSEFLNNSVERITMDDFRGWTPAIVLKDSINIIGTTERFIEQPLNGNGLPTNINLSGFIVNSQPNNGNVYLYGISNIYQLTANSNSYGLEIIHHAASSFKNIECINQDTSNQYHLWSFDLNTNEVVDQIISGNSMDSINYMVQSNPNLETIFYVGDEVQLGTSKSNRFSKGGIYKIEELIGITEDKYDEIHEEAERINNKEIFALEFFGNDYIFNYVSDNISYFKTTNLFVKEYLEKEFISGTGVTILSHMFNRYLLISDGYLNHVYDIRHKKGNEILFTQLETINGSSGYANFIGMRGNIGAIGYENSFLTFDGFSNIRGYGNVSDKYVALLNNFKRGSRIIRVLNENPDFLIGTTFGLKYVYNDLMTRSFYNKEDESQISRTIGAIEKVLIADNDEYFMVGDENSLFEVTRLYSAQFKKLHDFEDDEQILDIFIIQKNEYIIATTKGIWITSMKYELINDLTRFTIDNIYEIINSELKKIIEDHIVSDHNNSSIITKVNAKADNRLSFISTTDKHSEKYNSSVANGVKIIENDIIDTIVRGGESPDSDSYVKVGISNWALNTMTTESTYTDPGFYNSFVDPTSGKKFDISTVPYIVKNWKSGLKEIYIYVPTTGTYYANNPQGISNSQYSYSSYQRPNVPNANLFNSLPNACTTLRVYLYNSYFKIKTIIAAQCTGNSLPLKIYKDNVNANDAWKGVFDTAIQPSALRTLPLTKDQNVNNVSYCTDSLDRIFLDFSIYGTDAQAIRIIAET